MPFHHTRKFATDHTTNLTSASPHGGAQFFYCDTRSHLVGILLILLVYILRRYLVANTERMFVMTKLIFICWQENVSEYDARQTVANTATITGRPPH